MAYGRDVMVNCAATIVTRKDGIELVGEKEIEPFQFAFELDSRKMPYPEKHIRRAFLELQEKMIQRMYRAGMVRPG